ncbi:MAG: TolC family protein [Elusimicrobia bacterium]|nr:TolC family protein [Elusimicrobiota bacterium]
MARSALLLLILALAVPSAGAADAPSPPSAPLTAAAYVRSALAASHEVREALESWRAARDQYRAQLAAMLLPTLSFAGQDYLFGDDPSLGYRYHSWRVRRGDMTTNTTASWNVFNGFQDWERTRASGESLNSAARALDAARQDRAFAAIQAFYALSANARLRDVARDDLAAQKAQYAETQDLYKHGLKSLADLYKSENDWRASEIRLVSADAAYRSALQPFNELIAQTPWTEHVLDDALTPGATVPPDLAGDAARLPERRPEIRRALSEERRAGIQERQALLGLLPTLSVVAQWNRQQTALNGLPSGSLGITSSNRQVGLTLSLPFGFNGATQGFAYAAARASRRGAEAAADAALRSARDDLYSAWIGLESATSTYELSEREESIAARGLKIVETEYRQGTADALRMAQARSDLLSARVQTATALENILVDRAAYERAAGVPLW